LVYLHCHSCGFLPLTARSVSFSLLYDGLSHFTLLFSFVIFLWLFRRLPPFVDLSVLLSSSSCQRRQRTDAKHSNSSLS
jgi:hypothetical protein